MPGEFDPNLPPRTISNIIRHKTKWESQKMTTSQAKASQRRIRNIIILPRIQFSFLIFPTAMGLTLIGCYSFFYFFGTHEPLSGLFQFREYRKGGSKQCVPSFGCNGDRTRNFLVSVFAQYDFRCRPYFTSNCWTDIPFQESISSNFHG